MSHFLEPRCAVPLNHLHYLIRTKKEIPNLTLFTLFLYSANRIPERLAPGRFDYFLASHQIFHVCVVLAALAHYYGTLKALDYRLSTSRPCWFTPSLNTLYLVDLASAVEARADALGTDSSDSMSTVWFCNLYLIYRSLRFLFLIVATLLD